MNFGSQQGAFIGVGREDDGTLYLERIQPPAHDRYHRYALDSRGNPTKLLATEAYPFQEDEWYKSAVTAKKPTWSPIYQWEDRPEIISISSSYPVYNSSKQLVGVLGVDFILSQISNFLRSLNISPSGKIFVIERNGMIVASSSQEKPYQQVKGKAQRLNIAQSQEPLIREAAQQLHDRFGTFAAISTSQLLSMDVQGQRSFVSVTPWRDALGLNWLVITVIPESDFMGRIYANTRNTIGLCLAALAAAITIGILTARRITRPILRVSQASDQLAQGDLTQQVAPSWIAEVDALADSFNTMSKQLKGSFNALTQNEERFRGLVANIPGAIYRCRCDSDWTMEYISHAIKSISGYPASDFIRNQERTYSSIIHPSDRDIVEIIVDHSMVIQEPYTMDYRILHRDGSIHWFHEQGQVIFDTDGKPLYLDGAIFDITDRKQAEEALRLANEELEQRVEQRTAELREEKERSEQLLLNVLPAEVAERLKQSDASQAQHFEEATILFADIVGFTSLAADLEPMQLVDGLNHIFSAFDQLTERYGLEKIKTIGDAYMVVGGLPVPRADHAIAIAEMALEMQAHMLTTNGILGKAMQLRIGINTGPVIAGVIGIKKFIYDLWGDAVNIASRMESHGKPGCIQVTEATYTLLKDKYVLEPRGTVFIKGRGNMTTYWLQGRHH
jgi:PAS domain S-box-containing protein